MEDRVHNHMFDGKSNDGIKEFGAESSPAPVKIKMAKTKKFVTFEKTVFGLHQASLSCFYSIQKVIQLFYTLFSTFQHILNWKSWNLAITLSRT